MSLGLIQESNDLGVLLPVELKTVRGSGKTKRNIMARQALETNWGLEKILSSDGPKILNITTATGERKCTQQIT